MTAMTRRAALTAALAATTVAFTIHPAGATTMTDPYSPETATALGIGATTAGYIEGTGPTWDDDLATYNLREADHRAAVFALHQRDATTALHRTLAPPTTTLRILCVGDSITLGTGSTDNAGYRPWLTSLLTPRRINPQYTVIAQGGKTLRDMTPLTIAALPTATPDIVLIALGTNDAAQPDLTDWATRCGQLVDQILTSSPTVRVVVARPALSRIAWIAAGETTVGTAVDTVVNARKNSGRVTSADMTVIHQRMTGDGTHPLDAGYLLMAQQWNTTITPWLAP